MRSWHQVGCDGARMSGAERRAASLQAQSLYSASIARAARPPYTHNLHFISLLTIIHTINAISLIMNFLSILLFTLIHFSNCVKTKPKNATSSTDQIQKKIFLEHEENLIKKLTTNKSEVKPVKITNVVIPKIHPVSATTAKASPVMIPPDVVQKWANELRSRLYDIDDRIVRRHELAAGFTDIKSEQRNGTAIVNVMADVIEELLSSRTRAAEEIVRKAEELAKSEAKPSSTYTFDRSIELNEGKKKINPDELEDCEIGTYCRSTRKLQLNHRKHFDAQVSLDYSSVHVAVEVFDCDPKVLKHLHWSEGLLPTFQKNYAQDSSIDFQYFCSAHGFLRHYPAALWSDMFKLKLSPDDDADIYDCRLRPWYVSAGGAPRDVLILVDASGSMYNSSNKETASRFTQALLNALTDDDRVNVLRFNVEVFSPISCFNEKLVPANHVNTAAMMAAMPLYTMNNETWMADVLTYSVTLLKNQRKAKDRPIACQQAIVLLTDSLYDNYTQLMRELDPDGNIRLFILWLHDRYGLRDNTRELADWVTCDRDGYFAELITQYDVTQQVLKILEILQRPLVSQRKTRPAVFSDVYAHVEDPRRSEFYWRSKENTEQGNRYRELKRHKKILLSNERLYKDYMRQESLFDGDILKPGYRTVDFIDLEQAAENNIPRHYPKEWVKFRKMLIIDKKSGNKTLYGKNIFENGMRVILEQREYHWKRILNHYTAVVVIPLYNRYRKVPEAKFTKDIAQKAWKSLSQTDFAIQPDWLYCRHIESYFESREAEVRHFIRRRSDEPNFAMKNLKHHLSPIKPALLEKNYMCNEELMAHLCKEVIATDKWARDREKPGTEHDCSTCEMGSITAFFATENGLTRWQQYHATSSHAPPPNGSWWSHGPADPYYRRAVASPDKLVIHAPVSPMRIMRIGEEKPPAFDIHSEWYTAARVLGSPKEGIIGVAGFHFHPHHLKNLFSLITNFPTEEETAPRCDGTAWSCLLIDEYGWVVVHEGNNYTEPPTDPLRQHLATLYPGIMASLLHEGVFELIWVNDYQGVCFAPEDEVMKMSSAVTIVPSIINSLWQAVSLLLRMTQEMILFVTILSSGSVATAETEKEKAKRRRILWRDYQRDAYERLFEERVLVNRTRFAACDRSRPVYILRDTPKTNEVLKRPAKPCSWPLVAAKVPDTNLLLIAVFNDCKYQENIIISDPMKNIIVSIHLQIAVDLTLDFTK
ncbi:unnamed protein product [Arctia plantaginis]|uniref:VWFA domain-containing protein n=1 Tax=Arctia plantaginis TaxID=874455 RepID=A0A8S1AHE5_ARCPL|nr:unnamed protein product [Arctia plantaginis]